MPLMDGLAEGTETYDMSIDRIDVYEIIDTHGSVRYIATSGIFEPTTEADRAAYRIARLDLNNINIKVTILANDLDTALVAALNTDQVSEGGDITLTLTRSTLP